MSATITTFLTGRRPCSSLQSLASRELESLVRSATARATVSSPKLGTMAGGTLSRHKSLLAPLNNRTAPPTHCVQGVSKQQDDMAALSAQESKRAADIAKYVEQIPAAVVTEMLERVLNYTGEEDQRKVRMVRVGQQHLFSSRFNSRPHPWMRGSWFILVRKRCTTREPRATVHSGPPPAASSGLPCPTSTRPAMISDSGCRSCFRWFD